MPGRYGFEIVHGRIAVPAGHAAHLKQNNFLSIENLRQIKPFKFYTAQEPGIYPRLIRRTMIARSIATGRSASQR
jgi:hypothetical protein